MKVREHCGHVWSRRFSWMTRTWFLRFPARLKTLEQRGHGCTFFAFALAPALFALGMGPAACGHVDIANWPLAEVIYLVMISFS